MAVWQEWLTDETGTKLHTEKQVLLLGWARSGLTDKQIAKNIGIAESTLGKWKEKYPAIKATLKQGKEVADFIVENALFKKAAEGDTTAMIFWLKNRKPDQWQNINSVDKEMRSVGVKLSKSQLEKLSIEIEQLKEQLNSKNTGKNIVIVDAWSTEVDEFEQENTDS